MTNAGHSVRMLDVIKVFVFFFTPKVQKIKDIQFTVTEAADLHNSEAGDGKYLASIKSISGEIDTGLGKTCSKSH